MYCAINTSNRTAQISLETVKPLAHHTYTKSKQATAITPLSINKILITLHCLIVAYYFAICLELSIHVYYYLVDI